MSHINIPSGLRHFVLKILADLWIGFSQKYSLDMLKFTDYWVNLARNNYVRLLFFLFLSFF